MHRRFKIISDVPIFAKGIKHLLKKKLSFVEVKFYKDPSIAAGKALEEVKGDSETIIFHFREKVDLSGLRKLVEAEQEMPVVVVCSHVAPEVVNLVTEYDSIAVVEENTGEDEFIYAIKKARSGECYFTPTLGKMILVNKKKCQNWGITPREMEILSLLSNGMKASSIGMVLGISTYTVRNHVANIYSKLQVDDRVSAVLKGIYLGLVEKEFFDNEEDE